MNFKRVTAGMTAAGVAALAAIATAFGAGNTQLAGTGAFDAGGECTEIPSLYTLQLDGDLVGCLYTHGWEVVQDTPSGVYAERGTERFIGCLADGTTCGTFDTTYKFTAKYASDGSQIHGRCQHPITFGTGDFAGISGRLDFKDNVETGIAAYRGHIKLPNAAPLIDVRDNSGGMNVTASGCK